MIKKSQMLPFGTAVAIINRTDDNVGAYGVITGITKNGKYILSGARIADCDLVIPMDVCPCQHCAGLGFVRSKPDEIVECPICNSDGILEKICATCGGSGNINSADCSSCSGHGLIKVNPPELPESLIELILNSLERFFAWPWQISFSGASMMPPYSNFGRDTLDLTFSLSAPSNLTKDDSAPTIESKVEFRLFKGSEEKFGPWLEKYAVTAFDRICSVMPELFYHASLRKLDQETIKKNAEAMLLTLHYLSVNRNVPADKIPVGSWLDQLDSERRKVASLRAESALP